MKTVYFIIAVMLVPLSSCRQKAPKETATERSRVKVAAIRHEKMNLPVTSSGIVVPSQEIKLSFKTGGIIARINVEEGTRVNKGEVLATLNLSEIEAQVNQVTNAYEKSIRDYNRARNLYADSVVTLEQLQNAETAMNVGKASLEAAAFNLEHSRIIAPDNGTILKKLAETNEIIAPGYPVFLFGTSGTGWKIRTGLADRDFVRISRGDSARVTLDAYPGMVFRAAVSRLSEAANPATGTYEIELDLERTSHKLASGFVANLEIFPVTTDSCFYIPIEALVEADGTNGYVFTVTDSMTVSKVKVNIVRINKSSVAVSGGPGLTGKVVADGAAYLSDGDPVILAE
jgi:membrane fusion protein, multidrug efflux system